MFRLVPVPLAHGGALALETGLLHILKLHDLCALPSVLLWVSC